MSSRQTNDLEALSERLGSLRITDKTSSKTSEQKNTEMSIAPVPIAIEISGNISAGMPKSMVPDPG